HRQSLLAAAAETMATDAVCPAGPFRTGLVWYSAWFAAGAARRQYSGAGGPDGKRILYRSTGGYPRGGTGCRYRPGTAGIAGTDVSTECAFRLAVVFKLDH